MAFTDLFKEPISLFDLERFYDRVIDTQFWIDREQNEIKRINYQKYIILYKIHFDPILLAQLSILDSFHIQRRVELAKLIDLYTHLYKLHYGVRTDLFHGLPPLSYTAPLALRPRTRLPVNIPPPPIPSRISLDDRPPPIQRQPPNYYYSQYRNYVDFPNENEP